jgi:hypothetical protein
MVRHSPRRRTLNGTMIKAAPLSELETRCDRRACERSQGRAAAGPREMVNSEIKLSVPKVEILDVILRDRPPLFESASATETLILFLNTKFEISQRRPRLRRHGEDVPSINTLRLLFDRLVNHRSDNRARPNWNYTGKQELLRQLENGDEYADHSLVAWSTGRGGRSTDAYARHLGRASEKHRVKHPRSQWRRPRRVV